MTNKNNSQPTKSPLGNFVRLSVNLGVKTILLALASLFLLASCNGKAKQPKINDSQTEDTNKIYESWEVDEPPVMP